MCYLLHSDGQPRFLQKYINVHCAHAHQHQLENPKNPVALQQTKNRGRVIRISEEETTHLFHKGAKNRVNGYSFLC